MMNFLISISFVLSGLALSPPFFQPPVSAPVTPVSPEIVITEYDLEVLVANSELAAEDESDIQQGKELFVWKCSVCHDARGQTAVADRAGGWVGPWLDAETISSLGEDGVRDTTMVGTARMPGWQYVLEPTQVDQIIAYLKTVTNTE